MIELKNVSRDYRQGTQIVRAVHAVSFRLRSKELVTVVGDEGSGKTTLLRLMAGMENSTDGEILLGGKSTRGFKAAERDSWRSAAVGLVMDPDGLIESESALMNVLLPMSLAGMPRNVRRKRSASLLKRVGLGEMNSAYPSSLTEYDRRRLAVARALANDPDAILADEPFRGLRSEQAAELMSLFQAIAKDRLVVLFCSGTVPEREDSVRTIRMMNGRLIYDSNPCGQEEPAPDSQEWQRSLLGLRDRVRLSLHAAGRRKGSVLCALLAASLALGSLGLRLSLQDSLEKAESEEQRAALTLAPCIISSETVSESMLLELLEKTSVSESHAADGVYSASYRPALLGASEALGRQTDPQTFLDALEKQNGLYTLLQTDAYGELNLYASDTSLELRKLSNDAEGKIWAELPGDGSILREQYQVVAGRWCSSWDELVLFIDRDNELSDVAMTALALSGGESGKRNYEDICSVTYRLLLPTDYYQRGPDGVWAEIQDEALMKNAVDGGMVLRVVGIVKPSEKSTVHAFNAALGYSGELRQHIARAEEDSLAVRDQRENPNVDIFSGLSFLPPELRASGNREKAAVLRSMVEQGTDIPTQMAMYCRITGCSEADAAYMVSNNLLAAELKEKLNAMPDGDCAGLYNSFVLPGYASGSMEENLKKLGAGDGNVRTLKIYTSSLAQRDALLSFISGWNARALADGRYTELVRCSDGAESLASFSGKHSALLMKLLSAFAAVALIAALGLFCALLNGAAERQRDTLRALYLMGISPSDRAGLLRSEGLLLGLGCSVLGFFLTIGISALLPSMAEKAWNLPMESGIPWLAAAIALPGGILMGLLASAPACRRASALIKK